MLPSSPLHYLLFHALAGYPDELKWLDELHSWVLVATSANIAGHPLMIQDEKAHNELIAIADLVISYNRRVITRVDDSVIRHTNNVPRFIRRARGFSPVSVQLPFSIPSTLALGGHLKNTFCITRGDEAFISQHIGSLTNKETIDFFMSHSLIGRDFLTLASNVLLVIYILIFIQPVSLVTTICL